MYWSKTRAKNKSIMARATCAHLTY